MERDIVERLMDYYKCQDSDVDEAAATITALREKVAELEGENTRNTIELVREVQSNRNRATAAEAKVKVLEGVGFTCAHCLAGPLDAQTMAAHMKVCENHPMRELEAAARLAHDAIDDQYDGTAADSWMVEPRDALRKALSGGEGG